MLFAVLSMHKRLKVFRASGEREDIRGHLRSFPWDVLEAEVNRLNRSPSPASGLVPSLLFPPDIQNRTSPWIFLFAEVRSLVQLSHWPNLSLYLNHLAKFETFKFGR